MRRHLRSDQVRVGRDKPNLCQNREVRPVAHGPLRLKEAGKLGFERAMVPIAMAKDEGPLRLSGFRTLGQFVDHMLGRG